MRHAYLIIAHANPWQVGELIALLDDPRHDIFLHIDRRAVGFEDAELQRKARRSTLRVYREYRVYWGDYSQVQVPMLLMRRASEAGHYDYYHILSGMDMPLWTNDHLNAFFEANPDRLFLSVRALAAPKDNEKLRRARLYHPLMRRREGSKLFVLIDRALIGAQIILGVNRLRREPWQIMYGSNWASLPDDFVRCAVAHADKIDRLFRRTNNADELYLQTIAYNCGYMDRIYRPVRGERVNLHYTDWKRGNGKSPYTFREEDYDMLAANINPFARKFSQSTDRRIIEKIIDHLRGI